MAFGLGIIDRTGKNNRSTRSLPENSVVGPRASGFSPGKDGEAGDVGFIVDAVGCSQAENKPTEARSSSATGSLDASTLIANCEDLR
jgi:hypothetical protein